MFTGIEDNFSREELERLLVQLVQRNTENPPGDERPIVDVITALAEREGINYEIDEYAEKRVNIYLSLGDPHEGRRLLFNGHTDVVPAGEGWSHPPFAGHIENGRLYGRGACDMKAGVAAMLGALVSLARADFQSKGMLMVALVADEEAHQSGTIRLLEKYPSFDFAVVGEPSELGIITSHKANMYVEVTAVGKAAHASVPHLGVNALDEMARLLVAFDEYKKGLSSTKDELLGEPTITATLASAGVSSCIVPEECSVTFDRRMLPDEDPEFVWTEIQRFVHRFAEGSGVQFHLRRLWTAPGMKTATDAEIVKKLSNAILEVTGEPPTISGWPAVADSGWIAAKGIDTVIFGPGDIKLAHGPDEYVPLADVLAAQRVYMKLALALLGE